MQRMCSGVSGWMHLGCVDASGGFQELSFPFFSYLLSLCMVSILGVLGFFIRLSLYKVRSFQSHSVMVKMNYKFSLFFLNTFECAFLPSDLYLVSTVRSCSVSVPPHLLHSATCTYKNAQSCLNMDIRPKKCRCCQCSQRIAERCTNYQDAQTSVYQRCIPRRAHVKALSPHTHA
jgi:hypothetical protein